MTQRIGFFGQDTREAVDALEEHVLKRRLVGGAECIELSPAPPGHGLGDGMRRAGASVRLDLPMLWRALIRRGDKKSDGPTIAIVPPRGTDASTVSPRLVSAGVPVGNMAADSTELTCRTPAGTSPSDAVDLAMAALVAVGGPSASGEWMWAARDKGLVPR